MCVTYMYRLVTYSVTGGNPLALSAGPGSLAVLDGVRGRNMLLVHICTLQM